MPTVLDIISAALTDIGVLAAGEVPDAGQAAGALASMNALIDQLQTEHLTIATITRATATLTPSQASFTVGSGGNINITRPLFLERVAFVDNSTSPATEFPLGLLMTEDEYQGITQKSLTSTLPQRAYYNPTYPLGTLIPWPIPTQASLLWVVYYAAPVPEFSAVTDVLSLAPGYRRMLSKALAVELLSAYQRQAIPLLLSQAADAKADVKRSNERRRVLAFPAEAIIQGGRGGYDIRTG